MKFYMYDYLDSFASKEEAIEVSSQLIQLLKKGGFKLTKFGSNEQSVLKHLEAHSEIDNSNETHALGLKWEHEKDILTVSRGTNPNLQQRITQRVVLKCVASVFDPIGLVAPFTIQAHLWLKEIWKQHGLKWDTEIPRVISDQFLQWSESLPLLGKMQVQRSYFPVITDYLELHVFGDSSQEVFAAVAYLRAKTRES